MDEVVQKKSWFGRNWPWLVPSGCLAIAALVVGSVAVIFFMVMGFIKSSDVYEQAMANTRSSPAVVAELGEPIEDGVLITGNINISGSSGNADIAIPIKGPKGNAVIYATATRSEGEWQFDKLSVKIKASGKGLDLLRAGTTDPPSSGKGGLPQPDTE